MTMFRLGMAALIGLAVAAPQARAVQLPPGGTLKSFTASDSLTASAFAALGPAIASDTEVPTPVSGGGKTFGPELISTVYRLAAATTQDGVTFAAGSLVFGYKIINRTPPNSTTLLEHFNVASFIEGRPTGGYVAKYFKAAGEFAPDFVRSNTKPLSKVLGFDFISGSKLIPGQSSALVLIFTQATGFKRGLSTLQDGGLSIARINSYVPAPEPGTLALAAIALPLLGAGHLRCRRRRA